MVEFSNFYELGGYKDLVRFNESMDTNYLEGEKKGTPHF